ncbi:MAG: hypothetical protein HZC12_00615 [Nitrospirae bacterium]|nr:hypothetical protein [Nitrospirota bacterium]
MRRLKWILSSIFVLIIVLAYILYPTDEKRIKKVINSGQKAIEAEDIDGLMKYISYNYRDDYGNGYLQIKTIFQHVFKHLNDIEIERDALRITVNNDRAEAEFNVRVIASEGQDRGYILGEAGRAQNIKVSLEKSLNKWLIMRVEGVRLGTSL